MLRLPRLKGRIGRRLLVNYRADPEVVARLLPAPFRPKLYQGLAIVGICLIRLEEERPAFAPRWLGVRSENAAHRFAVEWEQDGQLVEGVYIPRRDTGSRFNAWAGGRVFPGHHHWADFQVQEGAERMSIALESEDGITRVAVSGRRADRLNEGSIFGSLEEASAFFEAGRIGYSATPDPTLLNGVSLHCRQWQVTPLDVDSVQSSFFEDSSRFPSGSIRFDCALLMENIEHEWLGERDLCCLPADRG